MRLLLVLLLLLLTLCVLCMCLYVDRNRDTKQHQCCAIELPKNFSSFAFNVYFGKMGFFSVSFALSHSRRPRFPADTVFRFQQSSSRIAVAAAAATQEMRMRLYCNRFLVCNDWLYVLWNGRMRGSIQMYSKSGTKGIKKNTRFYALMFATHKNGIH